jgi:cytochrome c biogenesis protein
MSRAAARAIVEAGAAAPGGERLRAALGALASLKLTLAALAAAALFLVASRVLDAPVSALVAAPFALLGLNLAAALAVTPALQRNIGLLVFHLALALVALLAAWGALAGFAGHVEVTEGAAFEPALVEGAAGPLHAPRFDAVRFVQGEISVEYAPGMNRRATASRVAVPDGKGGTRLVTVGDDQPLVLAGYRFYTSFNKGFAPLLTFADARGATSGAVHLPSYPLNDYRQGNAWTPPGAAAPVKLWLHLPDGLAAPEEWWRFRRAAGERLVVIDGARRTELAPGESVAVAGGTLRYDGLRLWMGYSIVDEPATPWLVAAALIGVLGLAWHVLGKLRRSPWRLGDGLETTDAG